MDFMGTIAYPDIKRTRVLIRGAGDLASGIAHRLFRSRFRVCLVEKPNPLAVRRLVSFCEAVHDSSITVEGVTGVCIDTPDAIETTWKRNKIPLLVDPENRFIEYIQPHVVVDAIMAKKNLGTRLKDAPLVIGMGPGFCAGDDVHVVVETHRSHNLGRLIFQGMAELNTGVPGTINGYSLERVFRAPCDGIFTLFKDIGDMVDKCEEVARVADKPIYSAINGIIRGILRNGTPVTKGMKAGDVDPRGNKEYCSTISDKARALGGAVLEAILSQLPESV